MRAKFGWFIGFAVWLFAAQLSYAWTVDPFVFFSNNQAIGSATALSPVAEAALINRFDVNVSIREAGFLRQNGSNTCTRDSNVDLRCEAFATDTTLQPAVLYQATGDATASPNGNPLNQTFAASRTWVPPPTGTLIVEHVNNCNWLITSDASNPGYTYVIEHRPVSGGTWSVTYNGVDTCVGRLAPRSYRAVYRDSGNNRGSYSSTRTTSCISSPPQ